MKFLFVSGGSGGHLAPLVAVAEALKEIHPEAEIRFLCSDRPEDAVFLRKEGVPFETVPLPRRNLLLPLSFLQNFLRSNALLRAWKPGLVFSKGGAVSVPCCLAAKRLGIPIVLHESDAVMGRGNKVVSRWAKIVCMGMMNGAASGKLRAARKMESRSSSKLPSSAFGTGSARSSKLIHTGNPVRASVTRGNRARGLALTGLSGDRPILLVAGGSQGAEALNAFVRDRIEDLLALCDVIHLTGKGKEGAAPRPGYWSSPFAHDELKDLYACATFALTRAGANFLAELAANGIPAIIVPLEGLAQNHQVRNAEVAATAGAGVHLPQKQLDGELLPLVRMWVENPDRIEGIRREIRSRERGGAARHIAEILSRSLARPAESH